MAVLDDAIELSDLLNQIIEVGGTTALETTLTFQQFAALFLHGKKHICCHVAVDNLGNLTGFQSLEYHSRLPENWADIATFSRISPKLAGVGTALFTESEAYAKQAGIMAINATIRKDNTGGIAYYKKMGFETYALARDVPMLDGTKIDRISKRLLLGEIDD